MDTTPLDLDAIKACLNQHHHSVDHLHMTATRLLDALAAAREELAEAKAAILELGDAIMRANGWEPQNGVTVELSSALARLVRERDTLACKRDLYFKLTQHHGAKADELLDKLKVADSDNERLRIENGMLGRQQQAILDLCAEAEHDSDVLLISRIHAALITDPADATAAAPDVPGRGETDEQATR